MSLDGTVVKNLVYEINNRVIDGRIDKIYQNNNDLLINIRAKGQRLLSLAMSLENIARKLL